MCCQMKNYLGLFGPEMLGWITRFWMPIGRKIILIGGSIHGCELAEFLVKRGRKVIILETSGELGTGLPGVLKPKLLKWLAKKGVTMMTEIKYEEVTGSGLTITTKEGEKKTIEADTILPAEPLRPNAELFKALQGKVREIYCIGDCKEPRLISDAIADGFKIANTI